MPKLPKFMKKQQKLDPAQQAAVDAQKREVSELRVFVKDVLYPVVVEVSTSISDAEMLCDKLCNEIQEGMIKKASHFTLDDLELSALKDKSDKNRERDILKLFNGMLADKSSLLLQGMRNQIKQSVFTEAQTRSLKDLDVKFYD